MPPVIALFSPVDTEPSAGHAFFQEANRVQERNNRDVLDELLCIKGSSLFQDKAAVSPGGGKLRFGRRISPRKHRVSRHW